jgi:ribosomal protein L21E
MSAKFKEGDRVRIADREATAEDVKSGLYQNHFRGLTGTIQKLYTTNEVAVEVELSSMSEAIAARHLEMQERKKNDFLESLSDEARNKLTPKERDFKLRYTVLVSANDLRAA